MFTASDYHENFIKAVRLAMAERPELGSMKGASEWLGMGPATLHKIFRHMQAPTVQHGITLCQRAGIDANWLFLGKGAMKKGSTDGIMEKVEELIKELQQLKSAKTHAR